MKTLRFGTVSFCFGIFLAACLAVSYRPMLAQNTAVTGDSSFHRMKKYYLALGDSAAFGLQSARFNDELKAGTYSPADFPGYVSELAAHIAEVDAGIQAVNMSCPGYGGTSAGFLDYCKWYVVQGHDLHYNYAGSQLKAATDFLQAHPGQVSPITIGTGLGELLPLFSICKNKGDCISAGLPGVLDPFRANLIVILTSLRATAPDAEILLMLNYNPSAFKYPSTNNAVLQLNQVIAEVGSSVGAQMVDMFPSFNQTIIGPQPDTLCALLAVCPPTFDVHPTNYGYHLMADIFWQDSGYSKWNPRSVTAGSLPGLISPAGTGAVAAVTLASLTLHPTQVFGPLPSSGTVSLTGPAPAGGAVVMLASDSAMARVPSTVMVPAGATTAQFNISTSPAPYGAETANISATYSSVTMTAQLIVTCGSFAHRCD